MDVGRLGRWAGHRRRLRHGLDPLHRHVLRHGHRPDSRGRGRFLDGLLLAWIRPSPGDVPLVAEAATELILLPVQVWLWFVSRSVAFLPLVIAPSVVSVAVAALLGRRLPPGPGPGRSCGSRRGRNIAVAAQWRSIEVMHGKVSAFRWQEQHDSTLTEAALTNGARDGAW